MNMLWEILVPTHTNEGEEIEEGFHHVWDEHVRLLAGGLTLLKPNQGQWVNDEGDPVHEPMLPARIACDSETIDQIASYTASHYQQKTVMYYLLSNDVRFKCV
jgi:hypothetical protein